MSSGCPDLDRPLWGARPPMPMAWAVWHPTEARPGTDSPPN